MNRLKDEKSLYLRQHAENPVDWYPWSEEALKRAKEEDKPIIVSIGYSACHWCHVMERESFEDPDTASIMNDNFISIKVDREERPDLDSLYMKAVQAMAGQGGWPLTVFATPEGVPFYGGTYFPPEEKHGLPSFKKVLHAVLEIYTKRRDKVGAIAKDVEKALLSASVVRARELEADVSDSAFENAKVFFDPANGGFGTSQKFPYSMFLKFLLKYFKRTGSIDASHVITRTLDEMASGGIYDHLGGGFHRYTVDTGWEVPHFEKMLYDNAQLAELYSLAYDEFRLTAYRDVAAETLEYLLRDMSSPEGGFYASQDADVEGEEGAYYLWDIDEVRSILGPDRASTFIEYFAMTEKGNCEGRNTLRINKDDKGADDGTIGRMKEELLKSRVKRKEPGKDKKIITAWNGLAISAFAAASRSLERADFLQHGLRCARFLLNEARDEKGRLLRYYMDGRPDVKGNLEDYAVLANGLLGLFDATNDKVWLKEAEGMSNSMIELFYDEDQKLFFDVGSDDYVLFVRERDLSDNDLPSGSSAAAELLSRLSGLTGNARYRELSRGILSAVEGLKESPLSYGNFLCVIESGLSGTKRG